MTHNHTDCDHSSRWAPDGRLIKWTYGDGCVRITDRPLPKELTDKDPPTFDTKRSFMLLDLDKIDKEHIYNFQTEDPDGVRIA